MFSLASIATMAACIFLFGLFFSLVWNFTSIVKGAEEGVGVTVFFEADIEQAKIDEIGDAIKARPEVKEVKFVSADEAWDEFKSDYFGNKAEGLEEGFKDDNPLANSASYEVYVNNIEDQAGLVSYIETLDGVRDISKSDVAAKTLSTVNTLIGYVAVAIILILLVVSIFLISNTVSIAISVRKSEISIMKLIGATDLFVRGPFILEGVIIGIIGAAIPLGGLFFVYEKACTYILTKFSVLASFINPVPRGQIFEILIPVGLVLGVGIGLVGSIITVRKHLRV